MSLCYNTNAICYYTNVTSLWYKCNMLSYEHRSVTKQTENVTIQIDISIQTMHGEYCAYHTNVMPFQKCMRVIFTTWTYTLPYKPYGHICSPLSPRLCPTVSISTPLCPYLSQPFKDAKMVRKRYIILQTRMWIGWDKNRQVVNISILAPPPTMTSPSMSDCADYRDCEAAHELVMLTSCHHVSCITCVYRHHSVTSFGLVEQVGYRRTHKERKIICVSRVRHICGQITAFWEPIGHSESQTLPLFLSLTEKRQSAELAKGSHLDDIVWMSKPHSGSISWWGQHYGCGFHKAIGFQCPWSIFQSPLNFRIFW